MKNLLIVMLAAGLLIFSGGLYLAWNIQTLKKATEALKPANVQELAKRVEALEKQPAADSKTVALEARVEALEQKPAPDQGMEEVRAELVAFGKRVDSLSLGVQDIRSQLNLKTSVAGSANPAPAEKAEKKTEPVFRDWSHTEDGQPKEVWVRNRVLANTSGGETSFRVLPVAPAREAQEAPPVYTRPDAKESSPPPPPRPSAPPPRQYRQAEPFAPDAWEPVREGTVPAAYIRPVSPDSRVHYHYLPRRGIFGGWYYERELCYGGCLEGSVVRR